MYTYLFYMYIYIHTIYTVCIYLSFFLFFYLSLSLYLSNDLSICLPCSLRDIDIPIRMVKTTSYVTSTAGFLMSSGRAASSQAMPEKDFSSPCRGALGFRVQGHPLHDVLEHDGAIY